MTAVIFQIAKGISWGKPNKVCVCVRATGCQAEFIIQVYHFLWWWGSNGQVNTETWQKRNIVRKSYFYSLTGQSWSVMSRESDVHEICGLKWWLTGWLHVEPLKLWTFGWLLEKNKLLNSCHFFKIQTTDVTVTSLNTVTMAAVANVMKICSFRR